MEGRETSEPPETPRARHRPLVPWSVSYLGLEIFVKYCVGTYGILREQPDSRQRLQTLAHSRWHCLMISPVPGSKHLEDKAVQHQGSPV